MRFRELERLTRRLAAGGYPTASLETALQAKLAQPALLPIMALLAVPFAFRVGRRGALAGVGVGLVLGILALIASAFLTKLGEVGALPPGPGRLVAEHPVRHRRHLVSAAAADLRGATCPLPRSPCT